LQGQRILKYPRQDSNTPVKSQGKTENSLGRGTESGTVRGELGASKSRIDQTLATALTMIAELPLTKEEKAQAVRRLLAQADEER
jgi:hypothetical protein